ncbi:hypothetical protein J4E85_006285 [Alternaria conjuncta]|uniref:uncharacterized protein n=1 Tax=Alternaria conjuncta TaxID=181017 RepID=UPI00222055CD|nr:uncharacterized protein J4E85_006285 [Alternaria conjuncta]KAI4927773.1 hypothetical protein J4E85_006285 [Alternaria conjuncta]
MATASGPDGGTPKPDFLTAPFLNVYERLPAHSPSTHAHIIDAGPFREVLIESEEEYDLKIQDAVATMLFKISKDTLDTFLSGVTDSFKLVQSCERRSNWQLIIWRQGTQVLIGQFIDNEKEDYLEWGNLVRCTINYDGSWGLDSVSHGRVTEREYKQAYFETSMYIGTSRELGAGDEKEMAEYASTLSDYIIMERCWSADAGSKWDIETTMAD